LRDLREQVSNEKHREPLASQEEYCFQSKKGIFIGELMNTTQFFAGITNMDEVIKDEDKDKA